MIWYLSKRVDCWQRVLVPVHGNLRSGCGDVPSRQRTLFHITVLYLLYESSALPVNNGIVLFARWCSSAMKLYLQLHQIHPQSGVSLLGQNGCSTLSCLIFSLLAPREFIRLCSLLKIRNSPIYAEPKQYLYLCCHHQKLSLPEAVFLSASSGLLRPVHR